MRDDVKAHRPSPPAGVARRDRKPWGSARARRSRRGRCRRGARSPSLATTLRQTSAHRTSSTSPGAAPDPLVKRPETTRRRGYVRPSRGPSPRSRSGPPEPRLLVRRKGDRSSRSPSGSTHQTTSPPRACPDRPRANPRLRPRGSRAEDDAGRGAPRNSMASSRASGRRRGDRQVVMKNPALPGHGLYPARSFASERRRTAVSTSGSHHSLPYPPA